MAQFTQEAKMFLRYFQRGEPISADKLNDIVNAVRANEVTPGDGYTVVKTPAGTSLNITSGSGGGGGGGGNATSIQGRIVLNIPPLPNMTLVWNKAQDAWVPGYAADCAFRVTDASIIGTSQVQVEHHTVNTPSARWPVGMGPGQGPFYIPITENVYIYVRIVFVANDVIVSDAEDAVTVISRTALTPNTVNEEYILLAVVTYLDGVITAITNNCASATANPCNLRWS
jgi:hypothetical protein